MITNEPIGNVYVSDLNPRRLDWDALTETEEARIEELKQSLKEQGQITPAVGRRQSDGRVELGAGQRRLIALTRLGAETIRVDVLAVDDAALREMAYVEQAQHEPLPPLDEAEVLAQMLAETGASAQALADLAARIGKSPSYVRRRVALLKLSPKARDALASGAIGIDHALLLADIPSSKAQEKLLEESTAGDPGYASLSPRALREYIFQNYVLSLDDAPFDVDDPTLVPKAGACTACPKSTGVQPDLLAGSNGRAPLRPLCTDEDCWGSKVNAHLVVISKRDGRKVLPAAQAAGLFDQWGHVLPGKGFVSLDGPCTQVSPASNVHGKPWRKALGKKHLPESEIVLAKSSTGKVVELLPKRVADAALREAHPTQAATAPERKKKNGNGAPASKPTAEQRVDEDLEERLPMAVFAAVLREIADSSNSKAFETALRVCGEVAATQCATMMPPEIRKVFGGVEGWEALVERVDDEPAKVAAAALVAAVLVPIVEDDGLESSRLKALCKAYGVKPKAVEKQLRAEIAAKGGEARA